jgi:hypothetical protein
VSVSDDPDEAFDDYPTRPKIERQPYEKPAFFREQVFETMALACGKATPQTRQCKMVKKNS